MTGQTGPAREADWKARLDGSRRRLAAGGDPGEYVGVVDDLVRGLARSAGWDAGGRALVALGGYGRRELAPRSDVDLLFLTERSGTGVDVERVLYPLWDLGFDVGHAVRTPRDCGTLADDLTVATALLDARTLIGDEVVLQEAKRKAGIVPGGSRRMRRWAAEVIQDVETRRARFGELSHLLEPHLKEGRGGLRDFHACRWVLACLGEEPAEWLGRHADRESVDRGVAFVSRARNALHGAAGRKTDHLTFEYHKEVSGCMAPGKPTDFFFQELHRAGHAISSLWDDCERHATLRPAKGRGFPWRKRPRGGDLGEQVLEWARTGGRIPGDLERALRATPSAALAADLVGASKEILRSRLPWAPLLRELHRLGRLGAVAPEVESLTHHVEYDARHAFTTGVHCIEALATLEDLWLGVLERDEPHLTRIAAAMLRPAAARVAALCHDLGKAAPGREHADAGADAVRCLASRMDLSAEETEEAVRLVGGHGKFPALVFSRDLEDPSSWADLRALAPDPSTLDTLVSLVYADLRATNPGTWSGVWSEWKRDLLLTAHSRASEGAPARADRDARTRDAFRAEAARLGLDDVDAVWPRIPLREAAQVPADHLARLISLSGQLGDASERWHIATLGPAVEVLGAVRAAPGLYSRLFGALASAGLDVLSFQAHTWSDGVVHLWARTRGEDPLPSVPDLLGRLESWGRRGHRTGASRPVLANPRREATPVAVRVSLSEEANPFHSVLEFRCRDRPGLLAEVVRALEELGITLEYALVTTDGPAARDVFHVKDIFGGRIDREQKRRALLGRITEIAGGPAAGAGRS